MGYWPVDRLVFSPPQFVLLPHIYRKLGTWELGTGPGLEEMISTKDPPSISGEGRFDSIT